MKAIFHALLWPFRALMRPAQQSVRGLRRMLYVCAAGALLLSLPAGMWCFGYLVDVIPGMKGQMTNIPADIGLPLVIVGATLPFAIAAVLQMSSAVRVLRKLPDERQLTMPGLAMMNAVGRMAYAMFASIASIIVVNVVSLMLTLIGAIAALIVSILYTLLCVLTLDGIDPDVDWWDRVGQIFHFLTYARKVFELQDWILSALDPPHGLITVVILVAYAIPTIYAVVIWSNRFKLGAVPPEAAPVGDPS